MRSRYFLPAVLIILTMSLTGYGQQAAQVRITGRFVNASLKEFTEKIESQTGFRFYFDPAGFDSLSITMDANNKQLIEVLDSLFSGPRFYYAVDNNKNIFLSTAEIRTALTRRPPTIRNTFSDDPNNLDKITALRERRTYDIGRKGAKPDGAVVISGYVKLTDSGEPVPGVSVRVQQSSVAAATDNSGFYSIRISPGTYTLTFTSIGLKGTKRNVIVHSSGQLNVEMQFEVTKLDEVVVKSEKTNTTNLQLGSEKLNIQTIKLVPSTFGEADVLKAILTLPGVKTVGEASSGFNVRGGATDQNLILFNGSTIYNPFHFFGFFSSFSPETVENVELFKGSVPSSYGGRLASVLNVTGRKGDKEKFKGSAGIGLLTGRLTLEGPILKDRSSFLIGARKTYSNWIFGLLPENSGYQDSKASFTDINLTLDHKFNSNNRIMLSGYASKDESNLSTDTTFNYSNSNFALTWDHGDSSRLHVTTAVGMDHFDYGNFSNTDAFKAYELKFSIDQSFLRSDFTYELSETNTLKFGLSSILYKLNPGTFHPVGTESSIAAAEIAPEQGLESAVHVEDNIEITPQLALSAGVRYSVFNYLGSQDVNYYAPGVPKDEETLIETKSYGGGDVIKTYHGLEPRASARYLITDDFSVKAGYTVMRQYIHMLSNTVAISPTDIWKLSDPNIKPQYSEQISLGFYKTVPGLFETSLEGYYKNIKNYLDYKSGSVLVMNPSIEREVLSSRGKAYGIEFFIKKPTGKFNGWISYTYSRTFLKTDDPTGGENVNRGEYYPASYDKPHDFNFTGNQKISRRFNVSLNATYSTGRPVTIPIGVFNYGGSPKTLFSDRNSFRIDDYFRMDISFNLDGNHRLKQIFHNSWTFGVYNLTGRKNPYSVFYTSEDGVIKGYKLSIFGSAIPFVNFNIRF